MNVKIDTVLGYQSWPPNTSIKLCNVTWDQSYRDVVRFRDIPARDAYFDGLDGTEFHEASYTRANIPVNLHIPFNRASVYNYMVINNDYSFDDRRKWFYFIQGVEYVNPEVTRFYIALDVWQSFCFDVHFGRAYVERGHIGIANDRQGETYGRAYLDIPEGLDLGARSMIRSTAYFSFMRNPPQEGSEDVGVLIASTTSLVLSPGTTGDPSLRTARGSYVDGLPNGINFAYIKTRKEFMAFMRIASAYPWATQGIIGIWLVPRNVVTLSDGGSPAFGGEGTEGGDHATLYGIADAYMVQERYTVKNFRDRLMDYFPQRYHNLKKFTLSPYLIYEITARDGSSIVYEPQYIDSPDLKIMEEDWAGAPSPQARFYPSMYGGDEEYNAAAEIAEWPKLVMVNNNSTMFLATNAHSLSFARNSADWSNQKTQMGINNTLAQAGLSADYASRQTGLGNRNRSAMNAITTTSLQTANEIAANQQHADFILNAFGGASGAAGSLAGGSVPGALTSAAGAGYNAALGYMRNQQQNQTREATLANSLATNGASTSQANSFATSSTDLSNAQALQFADMNADLSRSVATGDYTNTIAGINAKVQDSAMNSPTLSGAIGGDVMRYVGGKWDVYINVRTIPAAAIRNIGEFWLRYGYYVQRFVTMPQDLACMTKFTFWKVHEMYVTSSSCPEQYRLTIKGIFEKGVTVWRDPKDIGVLDYADNDPLSGISY